MEEEQKTITVIRDGIKTKVGYKVTPVDVNCGEATHIANQMNDKELLEKVANVIGAELDNKLNVYWLADSDGVFFEWNPLTDDGDALRLAVKLGMRVYIYNGGGDDYTCVATDELSFAQETIKVMHDGDPASATRRAITRAAAAMAG